MVAVILVWFLSSWCCVFFHHALKVEMGKSSFPPLCVIIPYNTPEHKSLFSLFQFNFCKLLLGNNSPPSPTALSYPHLAAGDQNRPLDLPLIFFSPTKKTLLYNKYSEYLSHEGLAASQPPFFSQNQKKQISHLLNPTLFFITQKPTKPKKKPHGPYRKRRTSTQRPRSRLRLRLHFPIHPTEPGHAENLIPRPSQAVIAGAISGIA